MEVGPQKMPFSRWSNAALKDIFHVDEKGDGEHQRAELVKEENGAEAAHGFGQAARPDALAEAHGQAGAGETEKGGEQDRVHVALLAREAHESSGPQARFGVAG